MNHIVYYYLIKKDNRIFILVITKNVFGTDNGYLLSNIKFTRQEKEIANKVFHGGITFDGFARIDNDHLILADNNKHNEKIHCIGFDTLHSGDFFPEENENGKKFTDFDILKILSKAYYEINDLS